VQLVCIEKCSALATELQQRPKEWIKAYEDDYAVIFERRKH